MTKTLEEIAENIAGKVIEKFNDTKNEKFKSALHRIIKDSIVAAFNEFTEEMVEGKYDGKMRKGVTEEFLKRYKKFFGTEKVSTFFK